MTAAIDPAHEGALRTLGAAFMLVCALTLLSIGTALAQGAAPAAPATAPSAGQGPLDVLKGAWVRPDGGYTIVIRSIGADGRLDAMYFNPNQLPFAKAQASRDGQALRLAFELQAGGYAGSTYELAYDAATDRLSGIYNQAVAKQKFEVYFVRKPRS